MPLYKEINEPVSITGTKKSWVRANTIIVNNPLDKAPNIDFIEEKVVEMPDGERRFTPISQRLHADVVPGEMVDIIHPETGAVLNTIPYQEAAMQFAVLLTSIYFHEATKRDLSKR